MVWSLFSYQNIQGFPATPMYFLRRGVTVRLPGREECLCYLEFDIDIDIGIDMAMKVDIDILPKNWSFWIAPSGLAYVECQRRLS